MDSKVYAIMFRSVFCKLIHLACDVVPVKTSLVDISECEWVDLHFVYSGLIETEFWLLQYRQQKLILLWNILQQWANSLVDWLSFGGSQRVDKRNRDGFECCSLDLFPCPWKFVKSGIVNSHSVYWHRSRNGCLEWRWFIAGVGSGCAVLLTVLIHGSQNRKEALTYSE